MPKFTLKFQAIVEILILGPRPFVAFFSKHRHQNFKVSAILLRIAVDPIEELS